jgi:hypothetical protein
VEGVVEGGSRGMEGNRGVEVVGSGGSHYWGDPASPRVYLAIITFNTCEQTLDNLHFHGFLKLEFQPLDAIPSPFR